MTVNQRIAQKRKELGLSQEALGEALGVSRQAIYKWESGATLPEIEKLIALSRIFSVSVGWLLGVEEESSAAAADSGQGDEASGELTEAQLKMVEEIVQRYQEALPAPPKRRRWPFVLAVIVLIAVFVRLFSQLGELQNGFQNVQNSVNYIDRNVDNRIYSITNQVEDILQRVNSFTVEHSAEIAGADLKANTVSFALQAEPKTYTEGMSAVFQADWGEGLVEAEAVMNENRVFSGTLSCPLTNEIKLSVVFLTGGKRETQDIQTFYELYSSSFPYVHVNMSPLHFDLEGDVFPARDYHVCPNDYDYGEERIPVAEAVEYRLGLFKDRELVFWLEKLDEQPETFIGDWNGALFFRNPHSYTLDRDAEYCLAMVVTDNCSRERVLPDTPIVFIADESSKTGGDWGWSENYMLSEDPADWKY